MWKGYHLSIEGIIKGLLYLWRYPNLAVLTCCASEKTGLSVRKIGYTRVFILCCFVGCYSSYTKGVHFPSNCYILVKVLEWGVGPWGGDSPYKTFLSIPPPPPPPLGFTPVNNTDLTIRQLQRQWKRRWKMDFTSFENFFLPYAKSPSNLNVGKLSWNWREGTAFLAAPFLKST